MIILYIVLSIAAWFGVGLFIELREDIYYWWIGVDDLTLDDQALLRALLGPLSLLFFVRRFIAYMRYTPLVLLKARKGREP